MAKHHLGDVVRFVRYVEQLPGIDLSFKQNDRLLITAIDGEGAYQAMLIVSGKVDPRIFETVFENEIEVVTPQGDIDQKLQLGATAENTN